MKVLISLFPTHMQALGAQLSLGTAIAFSSLSTTSVSVADLLLFMDMQAEMTGYTLERFIAEHPVPGREGQVLQTMGGKVADIIIQGKWIYENIPDDTMTVLVDKISHSLGIGWNWMRAEIFKILSRLDLPVMLACDFFVGPCIIKTFSLSEGGGLPNIFNYRLLLKEWNPALTLPMSVIGNIGLGATTVLLGGGQLNRGF